MDDDERGAGAGAPDQWAQLLQRAGDQVLQRWLDLAGDDAGPTGEQDARDLLGALAEALAAPGAHVDGPGSARLRQSASDLSARRGRAGSGPGEVASFLFALREALLAVAGETGVAADAAQTRWLAGVVDRLVLVTLDDYVQGRQDVITAQGQQLLELSTPVVRLWDRVVAAPLVGTLDSARAQVVMETLLEAIVTEGALVAILDITGVPTVDTLVAQHLLKTVSATRLMGAECIVSGIRPQTAQTIVQLGIDLADVTTRASLADALSTAIDRVDARDARAARG